MSSTPFHICTVIQKFRITKINIINLSNPKLSNYYYGQNNRK